MREPIDAPNARPIRWTAFLAVGLLIVTIYGCAIYANLAFTVTNGVVRVEFAKGHLDFFGSC